MYFFFFNFNSIVVCASVVVDAMCLQNPLSEYEQVISFPQLTLDRLLGFSLLLTASKMAGWGLSEDEKGIIQNSISCLSLPLHTLNAL